jgi:hypothetical protein
MMTDQAKPFLATVTPFMMRPAWKADARHPRRRTHCKRTGHHPRALAEHARPPLGTDFRTKRTW